MKLHGLALLLPLGLMLNSCINDPYPPQRSPYGGGGPRGGNYPYSQGGYQQSRPQPYDGYQTESGSYQQVDPLGGGGGYQRPAPAPQPVDPTRRPIPQSYDPDESAPPVTPQQAPQQQARPEYPTAKATEHPGHVLSPYPPYNVIDVSDIKSGHLAKDPSTGKTFRVP